ncbi:SWI5-dependent HO expression protein 4, partial [Oleoguttula sp. CCFEE 5521]
MTSSASSDRVASLLATANERRQAGDIEHAVKALREASHIEPTNAEVQNALKSIQHGEGAQHAPDLVQSYLTGNENVTEQQALQSLHPQKSTAAQATSLLDTLLGSTGQVAPIGALLAALINGSSDARVSIATRIANNATEIYEACFDAGEDAFNAFAS